MAKIKHIAIATQDPEKTATFYMQVFELESVGKINSETAEGYYLSDGNLNLAILKFKSEVVAGEEFPDGYTGLHHIGFQVDDMEATDARLRKANSQPREEINALLKAGMGNGHGGRNVELRYTGPEGIMIDVSQGGWVGTDGH